MEIRVTRPFIVSFIPGDQYGGPDGFISCLHVLFTEINQIKNQNRGPCIALKPVVFRRYKAHNPLENTTRSGRYAGRYKFIHGIIYKYYTHGVENMFQSL